jgi:hypothetical protein
MWWLPQISGTHIRESRRFESMYTLQGKIRSTHHTLFTLDPRIVPDHTSNMVHVVNLSLVPTRTKHAHTPERTLGDQRQTGSVIAMGHLILPPSRQPCSMGERFWPSGYTATSAYWTHIPTCDWYIQYLLAGDNPSIFNRHSQGLQPWRCRLSTFHFPIFLTDGLHFSPEGPTWPPV